MGTVTSILKVIASLPVLIQAFRDLIGWLETQFGPDWNTRIEDLRRASETWQTANTRSERDNAAKEMAKAFNSRK